LPHEVTRDTVFDGEHAPGVCGDVATDGGRTPGPGVWWVKQTHGLCGTREGYRAHARLDGRRLVVPVDAENRVHPGHVQHEASTNRIGAAGQPSASALRHDGYAMCGGDGHNRGNFFCAGREHDGERGPHQCPVRLVSQVARALCGRHQLGGGQDRGELVDNDGGLGGCSHGVGLSAVHPTRRLAAIRGLKSLVDGAAPDRPLDWADGD
jgi:hypothetical protein